MNLNFLLHSGPRLSPLSSISTIDSLLLLTMGRYPTHSCMARNLTCLCFEFLDHLHLCTSRRTRGRGCLHTCRKRSLWGILLSTKGGSSITPLQRSWCFQTELISMRGCFLVLQLDFQTLLYSLLHLPTSCLSRSTPTILVLLLMVMTMLMMLETRRSTIRWEMV